MANAKGNISVTEFGVGTAPAVTPGSLSSRDDVEIAEEFNLSSFTPKQLWCLVMAIFLGEFLCSISYDLVVLGGKMTGMGLLGRCFLEFAASIAIVSAFARYNLGHINPLITIILVTVGKYGLPWAFMFAHLLAQALAALVATLIIWALTPGQDRSLGLGFEPLAFGYTPGQGLGFVFLGSLVIFVVFLWMICAEGKETYYMHTGRDFKQNSIFALAVGTSHLAASLAFGKVVGTYFNWYLYFFPGVISGLVDSSDWWPFFVGPLLAAIFAVGLHFFWTWINDMAYPPTYLVKNHHHIQ